MTTPVNGYVPAEYLATLSGKGALAERNTAAAFERLKAAHPGVYVNPPAGGYWSRALDEAIHANPAAYGVTDRNLSPVGQSLHGLGIRLNIEGVTPDVAAQFGFSEFNPYTYTYTGPLSWDEPVAPARVATTVANIRDDANIHGKIVGQLKAGEGINPSGYLDGAPYPGGTPYPGQTSLWFYVVGIGYYWAGAFNDPTGTGLYNGQDDYAATHPVPVPPPVAVQATPVESTPAPASTPVDSTPTTPNPAKEPNVSDTTPAKDATPVIAPDLSKATLDAAASTLTPLALPYIPTKVRATIYTIGVLLGAVAAAVAPIFGGEVDTLLKELANVDLTIVGALALANTK